MTPKQKAEELLIKFERYSSFTKVDEDGIPIPISDAKECALICVYEILKSFSTKPEGPSEHNAYYFWHQVKEYLIQSK